MVIDVILRKFNIGFYHRNYKAAALLQSKWIKTVKRYDSNHGVAKCYLSGLGLEVSESDALLEFDALLFAEVLQVHLALVQVLQQHLDPRLRVVLRVRHDLNVTCLKHLQTVTIATS